MDSNVDHGNTEMVKYLHKKYPDFEIIFDNYNDNMKIFLIIFF